MTSRAAGLASTVLITGASRGLGAALALEYAEAGRTLALTARDAASLDQVAAQCRRRGAMVETFCADVTDHARFAAWVAEIGSSRPVDVLIANAGVFDGRHEDELLERWDRALTVLRVNLEGAVATVDAVLPSMMARRAGHIVLISSLAAVHPLADAPAYSASKAGLAAYGRALAEAVAANGVGVSVVLAGHIATRQARMQVGALPMLMAPATAARLIRRGVDRRRARIVFPRSLAALARLNALLPIRLQHAIGRAFRFHIVDPPDAANK
ncbi:MAG: SDR family NAD(P)-dependent oxidoreductase [Hyphomicrobiaceae bacterium]|nr:SDR family NAD(P)-dependent oxidoreductase [Hyphomicrobiaceae bacterium]